MTLFTNNPLERMMQQRPCKTKETAPRAIAPEGHFCHGCGSFGTVCVRPCYRDAKQSKKQQPEL
jgi:hypothetical protein